MQKTCRTWLHIFAIPELLLLFEAEEDKFKAQLGYIAKLYQKTNQNIKKMTVRKCALDEKNFKLQTQTDIYLH